MTVQRIEIPVDAPDPEDLEHHVCPSCGKPEGWVCNVGGFSMPNSEETSVSYQCAGCDHKWVEVRVYTGPALRKYRQRRENLTFEDAMTPVRTVDLLVGCRHAAANHPNRGCRDIAAVGVAWFTPKRGEPS